MAAITPKFWLLSSLLVLGLCSPGRADDGPPGLPRYNLNIHLDTDQRLLRVGERVTWTNQSKRPTKELVFNAHAHYAIPSKDVGLLAKTVELLRMAPSEAMTSDGAALEVQLATLLNSTGDIISAPEHGD